MLRHIAVAARRLRGGQHQLSPRWVGATCTSAVIFAAGIGATRLAHAESPKKGAKDDNGKKESTVFDVASDWVGDVKKDGITKFLNDFVLSNDASGTDGSQSKAVGKSETGFFDKIKEALDGDNSSSEEKMAESSTSDDRFAALAKTAVSIISGTNESNEDAVRALIDRARKNVDQGDVNEAQSYAGILSMFQDLQSSLDSTFSGLDFSQFDPTSMFYFLEYEDERKNPSWKRMMHRYHRGVDVSKVNDLNDALHLAHLAYANTVEEVKEGLNDYELIYFEPDSEPGKPSHFLALKKGQSRWSSSLEVVFVVRGTKTIPDMITDALLVPSDYRGGKAHDGVVRSGKYLVKKHEKILRDLKRMSGKRRIKLDLVGHSLGAAAASIAGMEFNDREGFKVSVVGFGCPALLSRDLSESTKNFITTVINDDDMVPRMSGATLANTALDIMEYDYTPKARRDAEQALNELRSMLFLETDVKAAMGFVDKTIATYIKPGIKTKTNERLEPALYPPGTCIHFYRDGSAISGSFAPCTFFNEIDVSRTMTDDHLIKKGYERLFLELMRDYHEDIHFKFHAGNELDF